VISARDDTGRIADAIELARRPFYCGMQGHPELTSRRDAPHPLIRAFVRACVDGRPEHGHDGLRQGL
jgi:CTP synthase